MHEMTNIYFFGCSFTAGDELSDEEWFPWKSKQNLTAESYYSLRFKYFEKNPHLYDEYQKVNKEKSYPSLIKSDHIKTFNYSRCGKSFKENVLDIIMLLESENKVDAIYFQIPPPGREMYVIDGKIASLHYNAQQSIGSTLSYLKIKNVTHDYRQNSLEDSLDIIMLTNYIKNKNIYFKFLNIFNNLELRITDVEELQGSSNLFQNIIESLKKTSRLELPFFDLPRLLGGHLTAKQNQFLAENILEDFSTNFIKTKL